MNTTLNILASKLLGEDRTLFLAPFCEVFNALQEKSIFIKSNYKLWFNNPIVTKHNSHGVFPYLPGEDVKEMLQDKSKIIWSILTKIKTVTAAHHIGNVSLQDIDLHNRSAEVAIIIGESEYYGKGIASFAVEKICDHGFDNVGLNRIYGGTAATNFGMQKVFEKLGFAKEATFNQAMFHQGQFIDVFGYGLTSRARFYNNLGSE